LLDEKAPPGMGAVMEGNGLVELPKVKSEALALAPACGVRLGRVGVGVVGIRRTLTGPACRADPGCTFICKFWLPHTACSRREGSGNLWTTVSQTVLSH
jgi:hypothetical protein